MPGNYCKKYVCIRKLKLIREVALLDYQFSNYEFQVVLSYQPRVTITLCYVYKFIRDLGSIDHMCSNSD